VPRAERAPAADASAQRADRSDAQVDLRTRVLDDLVDLFLREGFARFTLQDLARRLRCSKSTLYLVATSKEQLVAAVVRRFFQRATQAVEARVATGPDVGADPAAQLTTYLRAVASELQNAGPAFFADVAGHPPARDIYETNTRHAARRVQQLVVEGVRAGRMRDLDAAFVGAAVEQVMTAIHRGDIAASTGLGDADAYRELARLVSAALAPAR
jgi:AcrR family transcriptional regulator